MLRNKNISINSLSIWLAVKSSSSNIYHSIVQILGFIMAKILCLILCVFSWGTLFAIDLKKPSVEVLEDVLVSKSKVLSSENLATGLPVYASNVGAGLSVTPDWPHAGGWSLCDHGGRYIGGLIYTTIHYLSTENGSIIEQSPVGNQIVYYQGDSGEKYSESKIWRLETIDGKKYIVHFHEDFQVYSSADSQFVVAN